MPRGGGARDGPGTERRVHIVQGEYRVSADPDLMLSTILGSCVAACLFDPTAKVGGMNHFLLPGDEAGGGQDHLRYGVHAMELLINGLLQAGARRSELRAKLFGGARMMGGLSDIGDQNARFAERFLRDEGIALAGSDLRGLSARRVQFWPARGRTRHVALAGEKRAFVVERTKPPAPPVEDTGGVELF